MIPKNFSADAQWTNFGIVTCNTGTEFITMQIFALFSVFHNISMANDPENVNRAMSLLREAAAVLAQNSAPSNETGRSESGTPTTTSSNVAISTSSSFSTPNTRPSSSGSHPSTRDALRNFRTLFAPYGNTNRDTPHRPPPKKVCRRKGVTKQKETWTHEVLCLGSVDEQATPTRERKDILPTCRLGKLL